MIRSTVSGTVTVGDVVSRHDESAFIDLPFQLYARDAMWVPPLRRMEWRRWSSTHNPALRSRGVWRFLARRDRRVVGRVAAIVDEEFASRWSPHTGFFGFFECADDPDAAIALLDRAGNALRDAGMQHVIGPVNLSTHEEVGVLVHGFDQPPRLLDPYNPASYAQLIERAGYTPDRGYDAYLWKASQQPSRAVQRLLARDTRSGIRVRSVNVREWDAEVRLLHRLYNACFADLWGFVPITEEEMVARAAAFRAFVVPDLVLIAEAGGAPVGFAIVLPDANVALARARGRLLPLGWLRMLRAMRHVDTARFLLLGVVPAYRGRGVAAILAARMADAGRDTGIRDCELSLIQTTNDSMRRVVEAFGCPLVKRFRLYGKCLVGPA